MNSKRNWFSYLTWGIFIILTGALYYFSFHELMDNSGLIDKKYVNLVLIMTVVIIGEAFIIISHAISRHDVYISNVKRTVFGIVSFVLSFGAFIGMRVYLCLAMGSNAEGLIDLSVYERALIRDDMKIFVNLSDKEGIRDTILSAFFKFLGNKGTAVIAANLAISFITAIILFFAVKMLAGFYEACIVILLMGILPEFTSLITDYSITGTDLLFLAIGLFFIGLVKATEDSRLVNEILIILTSAIIGFMYLYNSIYLGLIFILLVLLIANIYAGLAFRIINPIISLIVFAGFFLIPSNMSSLLTGNVQGLINGAVSLLTYRFALALNHEALISLAKAPLMIVPAVLSLTYIVTLPRKEYDRIYAIVCGLIVTVASLYLLPSKDIASYTVVCIVLMAIIGGSGFAKVFEFGTDLAASDDDIYLAARAKDPEEGKKDENEVASEAEKKPSEELIDLNTEDVPEEAETVADATETEATETEVTETEATETEVTETEATETETTEVEAEPVAEAESATEPEAETVEATETEEAVVEAATEENAEDVKEAVVEAVETPVVEEASEPTAELAEEAEAAPENMTEDTAEAPEEEEKPVRFSEQEEGVADLSTIDYEEPVLPSVSTILGKNLEEETKTEVPEKFDNPLPLPKTPSRRARKPKKVVNQEVEDFDDNYDFDDIPDELMKYDIDF